MTKSEAATKPTRLALLRDPIPGDPAIAWMIASVITAFAFVVRVVGLGTPRTLLFDEIYYAKDGYALWHFGHEMDWKDGADAAFANGDFSKIGDKGSFIVHPPVGKWLIGLGEQLFGPGAFGWRFMSLVAGAALVMIVFFLARRLSRSTMVGAIAAVLLSLDGLHFVMSRIALLDVFQSCFVLLAVLFLVLDRDWFRARLARHLAAHDLDSLDGGFGPMVWWRPWRLAAGITFGLACAVKWNSIYGLALFSLLSVAWDVDARRLAGARAKAWRALFIDAPIAFVYHVILALIVYVVTWTGWLTTSGGYARDFADHNPDATSVKLLGGPLASLLDYHRQMFEFHTGDGMKTATHPYKADPIGWLFMARSIGIDAKNAISPGTDGCPAGTETCLRVIDGVGTPVLWWVGVVALVVAAVLWLGGRDWRFGVPIVGIVSFWVTWFPNSSRPLFFFYAIMLIPFTVVALALCAGLVIGPVDGPHRRRGAIIVGVFLVLVALNFAYFYPIWTDGILTNSQWQARMWLKGWI